MPKISVYLPDDLYRAAREHGLPISTLSQRAIEAALSGHATDEWIRRVRSRARRNVGEIDSTAVLDEVREDFGA